MLKAVKLNNPGDLTPAQVREYARARDLMKKVDSVSQRLNEADNREGDLNPTQGAVLVDEVQLEGRNGRYTGSLEVGSAETPARMSVQAHYPVEVEIDTMCWGRYGATVGIEFRQTQDVQSYRVEERIPGFFTQTHTLEVNTSSQTLTYVPEYRAEEYGYDGTRGTW